MFAFGVPGAYLDRCCILKAGLYILYYIYYILFIYLCALIRKVSDKTGYTKCNNLVIIVHTYFGKHSEFNINIFVLPILKNTSHTTHTLYTHFDKLKMSELT